MVFSPTNGLTYVWPMDGEPQPCLNESCQATMTMMRFRSFLEKIVGSALKPDLIRQFHCLAQNGNRSTTRGPAAFNVSYF
jgi:hypothetical protein